MLLGAGVTGFDRGVMLKLIVFPAFVGVVVISSLAGPIAV
ncbi:hypothetical protein BN2476_930022 [Paraburkholderia piptadeniae]|uniref:Uncharacterized protein n=1 Tax=Paraburkholderia piptadeniae TaxID=1701573 RepID=A0A1N7STP1_9BURK|nr:hypothetical protein BN2476_930022 [Paraburkholderia piptadeniae]